MNDKLIKELKDADFSFKTEDAVFTHSHPESGVGRTVLLVDAIPTLSELIEACGDRFDRLIKTEVQWIAHAKYPPQLIVKNGKTPEEAVARLWLALNKK